MGFYDYKVKTIGGETVGLDTFNDQVLLVVNVASACGLTPQYQGLQELFDQFKGSKFSVLGFPCNQFGKQEPGSDKEIENFCTTKFQVSFPMFSKIDVNGPGADPLYQFLKQEQAGAEGADIEWNFAKFLVDKQGKVVKRYHPKVTPEEIKGDIEGLI